ncbi:Hypothetical_protein [Hexamita inflata]|uniref:Hypothetical_protein n=1 Tax=Hexamita inflata TaxID=28002 RepID=A0AA86NX89_9EUKA|nr:Hypothetical protein HINF_LOCUS15214 [Hexamita inflata]
MSTNSFQRKLTSKMAYNPLYMSQVEKRTPDLILDRPRVKKQCILAPGRLSSNLTPKLQLQSERPKIVFNHKPSPSKEEQSNIQIILQISSAFLNKFVPVLNNSRLQNEKNQFLLERRFMSEQQFRSNLVSEDPVIVEKVIRAHVQKINELKCDLEFEYTKQLTEWLNIYQNINRGQVKKKPITDAKLLENIQKIKTMINNYKSTQYALAQNNRTMEISIVHFIQYEGFSEVKQINKILNTIRQKYTEQLQLNNPHIQLIAAVRDIFNETLQLAQNENMIPEIEPIISSFVNSQYVHICNKDNDLETFAKLQEQTLWISTEAQQKLNKIHQEQVAKGNKKASKILNLLKIEKMFYDRVKEAQNEAQLKGIKNSFDNLRIKNAVELI